MKLYWILGVAVAHLLEIEATVFLASLKKSHGPLYEGVKLLITDEKFNAELLWNETSIRIKESSEILHNGIHDLNKYKSTIEKFLHMFGAIGQQTNEFAACYKQYEREMAHLNRNILTMYNVCRQSLENAASYLANETRTEIEFIRDAATAIENVSHVCSIRHLKRQNQREANQAGVALCVVARIGQIEQRLMEASHFCLNTLADISLIRIYGNVHNDNDDDDNDDDSCESFNELKNQLEDVQNKFLSCVNGN